MRSLIFRCFLLTLLTLVFSAQPVFSQIKKRAAPVKPICGNGTIETGEDCDGKKLGKTGSCQQLGFESGILQCNKKTCRYDISQCAGKAVKKEKKAEQKVEKKPEKKVEKKTGIIDSAVQLTSKAIQKVKEVVGLGKKKELQRTISPARVHERVNALKSGGPWWTIVTAPTECESNCLCRNACYEAAEATCGENRDCLIAEFGSCPAGCQSGCYSGCRGEASAYSAAWTCTDTCIINYCNAYPLDCLVASNLVVSACLEVCGSTEAIEEFNRCGDDCRSSCADTCSESSSSGSSSSGTSSSSSSSSASSSERDEEGCRSIDEETQAEAENIYHDAVVMRDAMPDLQSRLDALWSDLERRPTPLMTSAAEQISEDRQKLSDRVAQLALGAVFDDTARTQYELGQYVLQKIGDAYDRSHEYMDRIRRSRDQGGVEYRDGKARGDEFNEYAGTDMSRLSREAARTCTLSGEGVTLYYDLVHRLKGKYDRVVEMVAHLESRIAETRLKGQKILDYSQSTGDAMVAFSAYEEANTKRKETAEQLTWIKELTDDPSWIISRKQPEATEIAQESATLDTESGATLPFIDTAVRSAADATAVPQASTAREALDQAVAQKDVILQKNSEINEKRVALIQLLSAGENLNVAEQLRLKTMERTEVSTDDCFTVPVGLGLVDFSDLEHRLFPSSIPLVWNRQEIIHRAIEFALQGISEAQAQDKGMVWDPNLPFYLQTPVPFYVQHQLELLEITRTRLRWLLEHSVGSKGSYSYLFIYHVSPDEQDDMWYEFDYRAFMATAIFLDILENSDSLFRVNEVSLLQMLEKYPKGGVAGWHSSRVPDQINIVIKDSLTPEEYFYVALHELVHLLAFDREKMIRETIETYPGNEEIIQALDENLMVDWAVDEMWAYGSVVAAWGSTSANSPEETMIECLRSPKSRFGCVVAGLKWFRDQSRETIYEPLFAFFNAGGRWSDNRLMSAARNVGYNRKYASTETLPVFQKVDTVTRSVREPFRNKWLPNNPSGGHGPVAP